MKIKNLLLFVLINVFSFSYFISLSYKVNSDLSTVIITLIAFNAIVLQVFICIAVGSIQ